MHFKTGTQISQIYIHILRHCSSTMLRQELQHIYHIHSPYKIVSLHKCLRSKPCSTEPSRRAQISLCCLSLSCWNCMEKGDICHNVLHHSGLSLLPHCLSKEHFSISNLKLKI